MNKIIDLKIWLVVSTTLLVVLPGSVWADGTYSDGTGDPNNPYQISTAADMNEIGTHTEDWDDCFVLTADINLINYNETNFNIIGNDTVEFTGVFDGKDHTISNFTWNSSSSDYVGLFGCVDSPNSEIKDLRLIGPNIQGDDNVGALVGVLRSGTVIGCGIEGGSVSGDLYVGGLAGGSNGTISNCYTTSSVSGNCDIGGLAGYNNGAVSNCYATGSVTGTNDYVGGLAGYNDDGIISSCYATGFVSGTNYVGGFSGYHSGTLSVSFWDTESSGQSNGVGSGGSLGITGKTTAQMHSMTTFLGWGSESAVWTIDDTNDYPHLAIENSFGEPISPVLSDLLEGSGAEGAPYLIYTPNDFDLMGLFSNEWGKHFKLSADIDLSSFSTDEPNLIGCFAGVFDGNGHSISNFICRTSQDCYIGLFRQLDDPNAEIKDLTLIEPNVQGNYYVGGLVSYMRNGTIAGCGIEGGAVSGDSDVGGLAGGNDSTISNCYTTVPVSGDDYIGGLAGYNHGAISNCYAAGSVTGTNDYIGGLVGNNYYGTISGCYATGTVTGDSRVGGLAGYSGYGTISNCYVTGVVTGDSRVGGLAGYSNYSTISHCYVAGAVTGADFIVGGLAGLNSYADFFTSFWDTQTTGQSDGIGVNYGTGTIEVYGRTTAQMQMVVTYTDQGWDFVGETTNGHDDVWRMCVDGLDYPKLWWEFVTGDFVCPDGVDFADFAVFSLAWLSDATSVGNWNPRCDISEPHDGIIDEPDLSVFIDNWLAGK